MKKRKSIERVPDERAMFVRVKQFATMTSLPSKTVYDMLARGAIKGARFTDRGPRPVESSRGLRGPIVIPIAEVVRLKKAVL